MNIFVFLHSQCFPVLPSQLPASSGEGQPDNFFLKCNFQSESIVQLGWSLFSFSLAYKDGSTEGTRLSSK